MPASEAPVGGGLRLGSAPLHSPVPLLTPKVLILVASLGLSAPDTERPPAPSSTPAQWLSVLRISHFYVDLHLACQVVFLFLPCFSFTLWG